MAHGKYKFNNFWENPLLLSDNVSPSSSIPYSTYFVTILMLTFLFRELGGESGYSQKKKKKSTFFPSLNSLELSPNSVFPIAFN